VKETLAALVAFERDRVRYHADPPQGKPAFVTLPGRRAVVLSAPHGATHWREGEWKQEEEYTSALVHWLAVQTGAHAIYATHALRPDPHADEDTGAYKAALADLLAAHDVRLVLDLHGVRGERDFALALGTLNGASCPTYEPQIVGHLRARGFRLSEEVPSLDRLVLNHPRYAGGMHHHTVTRFVWRACGVQAAQLEINAWLRVVQRMESATSYHVAPHFRADPARIIRLLNALASLVEAVG
jgi:hypothetical protein